jgi:hypothetical protein
VSTVAQKLGIKPGNSVRFDGLTPEAARQLVGDLPSDIVLGRRDGSAVDQLILVADGLSDLATKLVGVWDEISPDGRLWVWYRKGANKSRRQGSEVPLHRDTLQALLAEHGMDGVTLVSVDDVWSSMRVKRL